MDSRNPMPTERDSIAAPRTSICPLCGASGDGLGRYLICQDCYLTPIHLIAKSEGLLVISAGADAPKFATEIMHKMLTRRIQ